MLRVSMHFSFTAIRFGAFERVSAQICYNPIISSIQCCSDAVVSSTATQRRRCVSAICPCLSHRIIAPNPPAFASEKCSYHTTYTPYTHHYIKTVCCPTTTSQRRAGLRRRRQRRPTQTPSGSADDGSRTTRPRRPSGACVVSNDNVPARSLRPSARAKNICLEEEKHMFGMPAPCACRWRKNMNELTTHFCHNNSRIYSIIFDHSIRTTFGGSVQQIRARLSHLIASLRAYCHTYMRVSSRITRQPAEHNRIASHMILRIKCEPEASDSSSRSAFACIALVTLVGAFIAEAAPSG